MIKVSFDGYSDSDEFIDNTRINVEDVFLEYYPDSEVEMNYTFQSMITILKSGMDIGMLRNLYGYAKTQEITCPTEKIFDSINDLNNCLKNQRWTDLKDKVNLTIMSYTETMLEHVYDQYCLIYNMKETLDSIEDEIDFTREEIKDMIQYAINYNQEQFIKYYKSLVEGFISKFNFTEIDCKKEKIKWPKKSGVYVIWKNDDSSLDNLIYVGMTGKYKRVNEKVIFNSGTFDKRDYRYTPYRFCESVKDGDKRFEFRYGPKEKNGKKQSKIKYQHGAYEERIPYLELKIHCFHVSDNHQEDYTPELLEKEILTKYLKSSGNLPPANNEL